MSEIRIVHATGNAYRRGVSIGRALADGHARAVEFNLRYTRRHGLADADLEPLLAPYLLEGSPPPCQVTAHPKPVEATGVADGFPDGLPWCGECKP